MLRIAKVEVQEKGEKVSEIAPEKAEKLKEILKEKKTKEKEKAEKGKEKDRVEAPALTKWVAMQCLALIFDFSGTAFGLNSQEKKNKKQKDAKETKDLYKWLKSVPGVLCVCDSVAML